MADGIFVRATYPGLFVGSGAGARQWSAPIKIYRSQTVPSRSNGVSLAARMRKGDVKACTLLGYEGPPNPPPDDTVCIEWGGMH